MLRILSSHGGMTIKVTSGELDTYKRNPTYQIGGNRMQDMDYMLKWFHHFVVVSPKFSEGPCLLLKDGGDGLDGIAIFESPSERVFDQFHPRLLFIITQGSIEERLKHRAR
jgi:hypothetical protein